MPEKPFDPKTPRTGISGRESVFDKRLNELRTTGQFAKPNRAALQYVKRPNAEFEHPSMDSRLSHAPANDDVTEIERLVFFDPKSSLYNMRTILSKLAIEWRRSRRYKHPFSAIIIELDNMEKLEDLAPLACDTVFQSFCKLVSKNIREVDVVGRIGDSRLLVICPETSSGEGAIEAERLKHIIASARFTQVGLNIGVTCSFGVASYPEHADSPEDLFCAALDAIDAAVASGGNRVTVADFPSKEAEPTEDFSPEPTPQQVLPKKPEMAPDLAFPVVDVSTVVVP